jgi:hypothetical protein
MYERTYHKAVLKTEDQPSNKKKVKRAKWKRGFLIFVTLAVVIGLVWLIRLPGLQVQHIEVSGAEVSDPNDVVTFVQDKLQGKDLLVLPKTSIFLVKERTLEKDLKNQFSRFQTVKVSRKNFSTLNISVTEYQGAYLWCTDETTCYLMDQNGTVFAPAPYFSGSAYPKIFNGTIQSLPFQGISASQLAFITMSLQKLPDLGINPTEFHFVTDHELDIYFSHYGQQATLLFDPTTDLNDSMDALYAGLRTDPLATEFRDTTKVLQYIDLRFANRVVYKFQ